MAMEGLQGVSPYSNYIRHPMRGKKYNNLKLNIASNTFWNVKCYMSRISVLLAALLILRLCSLTKKKLIHTNENVTILQKKRVIHANENVTI